MFTIHNNNNNNKKERKKINSHINTKRHTCVTYPKSSPHDGGYKCSEWWWCVLWGVVKWEEVRKSWEEKREKGKEKERKKREREKKRKQEEKKYLSVVSFGAMFLTHNKVKTNMPSNSFETSFQFTHQKRKSA